MDFDDILEDVQADFPEIAKPKVYRWAQEAIRDLANGTWAWKEILTGLTTAGTAEYTLTPSDNKSRIVRVLHDGVQVATVNTPQPSIADGTATGTLTVGNTYRYKVTAIKDDYGETLPCAVVSRACPATGSLTLDWADIDHADGYKVYQSTDGTNYYEVSEEDSSTYTDDGSDTPDTSSTPPTKSELMKDIELSSKNREGNWNSQWRTLEGESLTRMMFDGNATIRFNQVPNVSGIGYQVEVALVPIANLTAIPAQMEGWRTAIADYIRSRVHAGIKTTEAPYVNRKMVILYDTLYRSAKSALKIQAFARFGGSMTVKPVNMLRR